MDVLEALRTRRSVRRFAAQPVEREKIEAIIDCARLAPSANNLQPWEFVVVTDAKMREEIARLTDYGKFIREAPVLVAVFCKDTKYYLEDGCAATENILLAAWALGLGSCWVAGDKKPYAEDVRRLLRVPEGYRLVSLVALGYPAHVPQGHIFKRELREVLHWEKF
ncbi:MAG: nitroreductase family protein [Candidatus Caldatribacterium sp.]|uniref:nitroreductase family protein n=1 Tax=Candidatus Caldatribacterium sp. TaxID=2282143 RepID=UPI00299BC1E2|nr:nitroreductase family protein [Candidatus Caldatribacterium sp.]MCX7731422.1 nitroreductase family protein [Candidatus Caldatribacterium sp.]MDW8081212.1 nitroreductase family protein [Candidatus Calescibacterium sp.]